MFATATSTAGKVDCVTSPAVDHDRDPVVGRTLPRGPDPERAGTRRPVEGAPALPPVGRDVVLLCRAERAGDARPAVRIGVRRELDLVAALALLEPFRRELQHQRASLLRALLRNADGDAAKAAQRNALFSLSKNPSSGL